MDAYLRDLDRPRPRSKAPAQEGPDLFASQDGGSNPALRVGSPHSRGVSQPSASDAGPPAAPASAFDLSEGVRRKEAALREFNERRGELMAWVRESLAERYRIVGQPVTADDAVRILALALDCSIEDAPTGAWMGALFRSSEWEFSHWTVSERVSNNGRSLRAWRLR